MVPLLPPRIFNSCGVLLIELYRALDLYKDSWLTWLVTFRPPTSTDAGLCIRTGNHQKSLTEQVH